MNDKDFTTIVEETKSIVLSAVRRYLFKSFYDYIDDVVQETYYKAYKSLKKGKFRGDAKISSWLYCIARNESINFNKKMTKYQSVSDKLVDDLVDNVQSDDYRQEKLVLDSLTQELSERNRKAFELFIQHCPLSEIAKELNLNENTVKTIIYRTKKQFVKQLLLNGEANE